VRVAAQTVVVAGRRADVDFMGARPHRAGPGVSVRLGVGRPAENLVRSAIFREASEPQRVTDVFPTNQARVIHRAARCS